jgi:hypothetical protein
VRRAAALIVAALAAALVLVGCGGGSSGPSLPPQGPPSARHPASDLDAAIAGEQIRAQILEATRLYGNGRFGFASEHMNRAQAGYRSIMDAVRLRDSALDREFHAAFGVIAGQIAQRAPALAVANRMGLMQGQLLDAAIADSVSLRARTDPGVSALVVSTLAGEAARTYDAAAREGFTDQGRRGYQDAFGLIIRAVSVAHAIGPSLGPEQNHIINALNAAKNQGFPTGILRPAQLQPVRVVGHVARAQAAISRRFGFPT